MNFAIMKKKNISAPVKFIVGLLVIIAIWASAVLWVPKISSYIAAHSDDCVKSQTDKNYTEACSSVLSRYGATGDLFGVVTSLFSALGLFAVAFTVHIEAKARKSELKPFIVSKLGEGGITLQDPSLGSAQKIDLRIPLTIKNVGEIAINVGVQIDLEEIGKNIQIAEALLEGPLVTDLDNEETVVVSLENAIFNKILESLASPLQEPAQESASSSSAPSVTLIINILCDSLSGVKWTTTVKYSVSLMASMDRDILIALLHRTEDRAEKWENKRSVPLAANVVKGSWKYSQGDA